MIALEISAAFNKQLRWLQGATELVRRDDIKAADEVLKPVEETFIDLLSKAGESQERFITPLLWLTRSARESLGNKDLNGALVAIEPLMVFVASEQAVVIDAELKHLKVKTAVMGSLEDAENAAYDACEYYSLGFVDNAREKVDESLMILMALRDSESVTGIMLEDAISNTVDAKKMLSQAGPAAQEQMDFARRATRALLKHYRDSK